MARQYPMNAADFPQEFLPTVEQIQARIGNDPELGQAIDQWVYTREYGDSAKADQELIDRLVYLLVRARADKESA